MMNFSTGSSRFNHDPDAAGYDADVTDETNPIRDGYGRTLAWVAGQANRMCRCPAGGSEPWVLDLGCGTGNSILPLRPEISVTAVDISRNMVRIARAKLPGRTISWEIDDILHYVDSRPLEGFDTIISTYALHHLTPAERQTLFLRIGEKTHVDVSVVVGDLMYADESDRRRIIDFYGQAYPDLAADFADEFFWKKSSLTFF